MVPARNDIQNVAITDCASLEATAAAADVSISTVHDWPPIIMIASPSVLGLPGRTLAGYAESSNRSVSDSDSTAKPWVSTARVDDTLRNATREGWFFICTVYHSKDPTVVVPSAVWTRRSSRSLRD